MAAKKKPALVTPSVRGISVVNRVITKYQHRTTKRRRSRGDKRRAAINDSRGE